MTKPKETNAFQWKNKPFVYIGIMIKDRHFVENLPNWINGWEYDNKNEYEWGMIDSPQCYFKVLAMPNKEIGKQVFYD